jgi:hypothetical protein
MRVQFNYTKPIRSHQICYDDCSYLKLSMQEKLAKTIDKEMNSKISSRSRTTKDVTSIVKKELAIFEVEGKRGVNFESSFENLNSLPPSSVEPERAFSGC